MAQAWWDGRGDTRAPHPKQVRTVEICAGTHAAAIDYAGSTMPITLDRIDEVGGDRDRTDRIGSGARVRRCRRCPARAYFVLDAEQFSHLRDGRKQPTR